MTGPSHGAVGDPVGANAATEPGPLPSHLHPLRQIHRGLRRDARRLQGVVRILPARSATVQGWWDRVGAVLDWHLDSKEQLLYPALRTGGSGAENQALLLDDHAALRAAAQSVTRALVRACDPSLPGDPGHPPESLESIVTWFGDLLLAHLTVAEHVLWPAITRSLTRSEFLALERRVLLRAGPSTMAFLGPWVLDGLDDEAAPGVVATMPPPIRVLSRTVLAWRYQRWRWW